MGYWYVVMEEVFYLYVIIYVREIIMIIEWLLLLFGWWNSGIEKLDNMSYFKVIID